MIRVALAALLLAACGPVEDEWPQSLYWTDGDSGVVNGMKFRLADVDAPETGGVGSVNGAKCERERELGFAAKEFIVEATREKSFMVTARDAEPDAFGRVVISLSVEGEDIAELGLRAGVLRPYVFENGRAKQRKPDWCEET